MKGLHQFMTAAIDIMEGCGHNKGNTVLAIHFINNYKSCTLVT